MGKMINYFSLFVLSVIQLLITSCKTSPDNTSIANCTACNTHDASAGKAKPLYENINGALLGSRFQSLDELKTVIDITYVHVHASDDDTVHKNSKVLIKHCSNGCGVIAELAFGTSQNDISKANLGKTADKLAFITKSPYCVSIRKDLERIFLLARLRSELFGEGDVAFFNLAEAIVKNINTPALAFLHPRDTTEKGYLNTFNHITAQAFITSCFSEALADYVADAHERAYHPELIHGHFTEEKLHDLAEGPVDNYVDVINNEWGQELGKVLKEKHHITRETIWTPEVLTNYLNDIQAYYSWAFQIGFTPFQSEDEQIIKFSKKLTKVMHGF
jgi:hypothetical protein